MPRLRIVLVEPQEAGNIGAAARVMKNFGFDEMYIVGNHPELFPVAGWWASGADDVLRDVQFRDTLHDAVADARLTVATTSMRGRTAPVEFTPATLAGTFAALDGTLALVFGREDSGLTREELVLCQRAASITTNDAFPTMNLAQSVGVFCYALSSIRREEPGRQLAQAALVERFHEQFEALLFRTGFLHADNPARLYDDLRALFGRAELDEREVTILLGIIRQIEWALRQSNGPDSDNRR